MKQLFIALLTVFFLSSCNNPELETELADSDWYMLRAPGNREIQAVYGDIDDILLITDRFRIYYTKDKGKSWNQASYDSNIGLAGFARSNDTLFVLDTQTTSSTDPGNRYAIRPYYFSIDGGISWQKLQQHASMAEMKTPLNYGHSGNGIRFSMDQVFYDNGTVEDKGIISENGRKISLPQHHILTNVYFDKKSRLYVSGSAPLCSTDGYLQLCDKQDERGTLYISKQAIDY